MADRGAGEGLRTPPSMPSPCGRGRGRGGKDLAAHAAGGLPQPGFANSSGSPNPPDTSRALRRPKVETCERLLNVAGPGGDAPAEQQVQAEENFKRAAEKETVPKELVVKSTSKLNVNAPEFVSKSNLNVDAKEFIPGSYQPMQKTETQKPNISNPSSGHTVTGRLEEISTWTNIPEELTRPTHNYAIDRVKQVVFHLTTAPGNLEDFMVPLVADLHSTKVDLNTVIDIVNVIFEQAVVEQNFTYTGARMCDWLCRHYKPMTEGQPIKFLSLLVKRCQVEHENSVKSVMENPARLQGFALFMAELYLNVKIVGPNSEDRIDKLGDKLKDLVKLLLQNLNDGNLKCVVRIMKCTGAVLEDTERAKTGQAVDMDAIMGLVMQQALSPTASQSIRTMLTKVAEIRATNWGRLETYIAPMPVQIQRAPQPYTQSDPIFYNEYGHVITREEAGFAEEESDEYIFNEELDPSWTTQEPVYDNSFDNGYTDNEIDPEIAEAFEQFLIETDQT